MGGEDGGLPKSGTPTSKLTQHALWFPFFTLASVSMVLLNKFCAHQFQQPYSLLGFQNSVTILLNIIGIWGGVFKIKALTTGQFKLFLLPSFLFVGMLITSLYGLPYVSVATTVVFRAVSTCLVGIGDYFIFGKRFSNDEMAMMAVVVIGAQIYATNDLSFHITGYKWMFANTTFFVVAQLYEKWAITSVDQTPVGISIIQNLLSLPIIIVFGGYMREDPIGGLAKTDVATKISIVATGFAGCALSICYMSLSKFASATAISLAGNFNKLASIIVGAAIFHNPLSLLQSIGLVTSMLATIAVAQKGQLPSCMGGGGAASGGARSVTLCLIVFLLITVAAYPIFLDPGLPVGEGAGIGKRVSARMSTIVRRIRGASGAVVPGGGNITASDLSRADVLVERIARGNKKIRELSKMVQESTTELQMIIAAPRMVGGSAGIQYNIKASGGSTNSSATTAREAK